jgi:hypothetical protein
MTLQVDWNKCQGGAWCELLKLNLEHQHFNDMEGVYIIWHGGQNPATVCVGQGIIRDRLAAHRQENDVLAYKQKVLYVTWARVPADQRDGVEKYLAERLAPKMGSRFPEVTPIEINLPW